MVDMQTCEVGEAPAPLTLMLNSKTFFCRMSNSSMVAVQMFSLAFGLMTVTNKTLKLGMWNLV